MKITLYSLAGTGFNFFLLHCNYKNNKQIFKEKRHNVIVNSI